MGTFLFESDPVISPNGSTGIFALSRNQSLRPLGPVRILYVNDDLQQRRFGELVLVRSGYDVDTAADGAQGWEALQHAHYNLLITDHDMPRLTGMELIIQACEAGMRLPIVLTSGDLNPMHDLANAESDLAVFLAKPFAPDMLVGIVEQLLCAANNLRPCASAMISLLGHMAHSADPYLHGGINE